MASKSEVLSHPPRRVWRGPVLLAWWCPAWRRRDPGLRLLHGTGEGERSKAAVRACGSVRRAARGSVPTADTGGIEYRLRRALADWLVLAVKSLLLGWGWSEGAG